MLLYYVLRNDLGKGARGGARRESGVASSPWPAVLLVLDEVSVQDVQPPAPIVGMGLYLQSKYTFSWRAFHECHSSLIVCAGDRDDRHSATEAATLSGML